MSDREKHKLETDLLERARAGDESAFTALVGPLRERIYWRAAKAVGDLDEAEDITQETLMRAFTRLETFRGDARFSSWVYKVGTNCIRLHLRAQRRKGDQQSMRIDDHLGEIEANQAVLKVVSLTLPPDERAMTAELMDALNEAISNLPPQYGSILRLWVEDGLDLKQIHEHSGLSIAAIKTRLHRARRWIKAAIEEQYGAGTLLAA